MGKGKYRAVFIKDVDASGLKKALSDQRCVVGIDVAKADFFASVMDASRQVRVTVKWTHPADSREFVEFVSMLSEDATVELAMEPTGVYGDALRERLLRRGHALYRVSPKRAHDAAEVYDGVPSLHDAKSAAIIARLHQDGASEPWPVLSDHERGLTAALRVLELHDKQMQRNIGQLEACVSRHWPELTTIMSLTRATLVELLATYGGPAAVARDPDGARELMRRVGRHMLASETIEAVVASAHSSFGMGQTDEETRMVRAIAAECRRHQLASNKARRRVERLSVSDGASLNIGKVVGKTTAAVLTASVGTATKYETASAYEKSFGLNLKEKSSGRRKGALHITKRGPGVARRYLYLAVLRLLQTDEVIQAWYAKKAKRDGGCKQKAIIAIMRKLVRALWHVARGNAFDSTKLYDVSRLELEEVPTM